MLNIIMVLILSKIQNYYIKNYFLTVFYGQFQFCRKFKVGINLYFLVKGAFSFPLFVFTPFFLSILESANFCFSIFFR
jgi:hypothetical protein